MIEHGMLDLSVELLSKKTSPKELALCLNIIWEISLSEGLRPRIKNHLDVVKEVEKMTSNADQEVKKIAISIKWNLQKLDEIEPCPDQTQVSEGTHIMVSYSWDQKEIVKLLVDKLNIAGKQYWLDTKEMQGKIFDTPSKAVEDASHVICCVSESYFKSTYCREEAVYANAMKKKMIFVRVQRDYVPKDWLKFVMADHYYYTMTCPEEVERNFPELLNFIENGSCPDDEWDTNDYQPLEVFQQVSNPATEGYQNWSSVEVASWFAGTGCHRTDQVERELKTMDGKFLLELCSMQELSPESFRIFLQEDFGFVQSLDLLRFSNAVSFLRLSQAEN